MKRVVITGATGVIGRALVNRCIGEGCEVLALVHRESERADELAGIQGLSLKKLNLCDYALEADLTNDAKRTDYDVFFHLAWTHTSGAGAQDPLVQADNIKHAVDAVELASSLGCKTFVGVGSQAEYGRKDCLLSTDTPLEPESAYGVAKLAASTLTRIKCSQLGMKHVWTRVLSVYGPHDRSRAVITKALTDMMNGRETAFTPCEQIWDFVYSDDAARAIILAADKGEDGGVYIVGSGESARLKKYIEKVAKLTGYNKEIGFGRIPYFDKQVMRLETDISELKELGFEVRTSFEEGIKRMMEEYIK